MTISRDDALALVREHLPEPNLIQHSLASEAVLRRLAVHLGHDPEAWGLAGLLHDLDYAASKENPARHGLASAELLAGRLPGESLEAIRRHAYEMNGCPEPSTPLDLALRCGETVTGLITAAALMRPTRLEGMEPKSLVKKMKDKAFARSVNRETIRECERIGLDLKDFLALGIAGMQSAAADLGLE